MQCSVIPWTSTSKLHCSLASVAILWIYPFVPIPLMLWNISLKVLGGFSSGGCCPFQSLEFCNVGARLVSWKWWGV